jgi:tetratricopeptide (TPR) repeat protein
MTSARLPALILFSAFVLGASIAQAAAGPKDQEMLNQGKVLIFDRKWEEARVIFHRVISEFPRSSVVPQAYYYIARCFQFQGRESEALQAYEDFLKRYPAEPFLPAEARNAVVEIAATLLQQGNAAYKDRLISALADTDRNVRYFAAIRTSRLDDRSLTAKAVPVLREIVRTEKEPELSNRARIALLRLDPNALTQTAEAPPKPQAKPELKPEAKPEPKKAERMFHVVVIEGGAKQPKVELTLPVSLAQLAIAALDESARKEIRKKGIDVDNVWESLKRLGPTNILVFRDGGNTVKIWIE